MRGFSILCHNVELPWAILQNTYSPKQFCRTPFNILQNTSQYFQELPLTTLQITSQFVCRVPLCTFAENLKTISSVPVKYILFLENGIFDFKVHITTSNWCHEVQIIYAFSLNCSEVEVWYEVLCNKHTWYWNKNTHSWMVYLKILFHYLSVTGWEGVEIWLMTKSDTGEVG